jgi:hypothetical protein
MDYDWQRVSRDEWFAFISQFPDRFSYKTGICEPPKQMCELPDGQVIAHITFGDWPAGATEPDWNAKVYQINKAVKP